MSSVESAAELGRPKLQPCFKQASFTPSNDMSGLPRNIQSQFKRRCTAHFAILEVTKTPVTKKRSVVDFENRLDTGASATSKGKNTVFIVPSRRT